LIRRLTATGLRDIEATSFVSPKWVPRMADHAKIMKCPQGIPACGKLQEIPQVQLETLLVTGLPEHIVLQTLTDLLAVRSKRGW
jgi:hypothetical protein